MTGKISWPDGKVNSNSVPPPSLPPPTSTPLLVYTMARSALWGRNELPTADPSMAHPCPAEVNHQPQLRHFCFADGCTLEYFLSGQQVVVSLIIHHVQIHSVFWLSFSSSDALMIVEKKIFF